MRCSLRITLSIAAEALRAVLTPIGSACVAAMLVSCGARVDESANPPALRPADPTVVQITVAAGHACVLRADRRIVCWGGNVHGQAAGAECLHEPACITAPHFVDGLGAATRIVASNDATCARVESGALWCWGEDSVVACTPMDASTRRTSSRTSGAWSDSISPRITSRSSTLTGPSARGRA